MLRRVASYYPLALTLLFGLVLSLFPTSPALGDNIGVCQGTVTGAATVKLGGRVITPSQVLLASGNQLCSDTDSALNLVSMSHTIVVSPNGTPAQNGTALLTAMATISKAVPSVDNPWLLKLEPGNYNLGNKSLILQPFVDLEGSGEDNTVISSTAGTYSDLPDNGALVVASNTETRFLKIIDSGAVVNKRQIGVVVPSGYSNVHLTHVTITVSNPEPHNGTSYALVNYGATILQNNTISVLSSMYSGGIFNSGSPANLFIQDSTITTNGSTTSNGIENDDGTVTVQNSNLTASGVSNSSYGLVVYGTNNTSSVTIQNSTVSASGGTPTYAVYNLAGPGLVRAGASQLSGSTGASSGLTLCPSSYNGTTFQPLNSGCQ
ncbi:MAG TPA: hypothetical protein VH186_21735 [Chloroflexia bacterium]|nr:hypothetical protein [Chloroflexia bacterium]